MSAAQRTAPRRTRVLAWAGFVAAVIVVAIAGGLLAQSAAWSERGVLDPESAGPDGARAVVRVLEAEGIEVRVARDRAAAAAALAGSDATLALPDAPGLSDAAVRELVAGAGDVVLLEPRSRTLRLLLPGSTPAGAFADEEVSPACGFPPARRAGDIVAGELFAPATDGQACYRVDDGYALVTATQDGRSVTAVDGRTLLANDGVDRAGNAALALALLGARPTLVWYVPSPADADGAAPTLGELTPPWVTPAIVLLLVAGAAAALWRGRRFGPLVAETLPVTVRGSETTAGRARLYARARDTAHTAEQLRSAALARLRRILSLGPHAAPAAVADAAAARLSEDPAAVRRLLLADAPATDRELVDFSDRLHDLEAAVAAAARPEGTTR
ncbi:DUF4350 domain-containing protein [Microbacterium lushaniae]|nr:DUF4350 domain-containing protein [Microbacterium lushaniae]KAA9152685.1 DUF4350 domain-containing protein [Microbacterium lushaniae]